MTLFAVYNPDGSISQANKVYNPEGYDRLLSDRGLAFVADAKAEHLGSHDHWMVDTNAKVLVERPLMPIVYQSTVKAGSTAVVSNIPKGAALDIHAAGSVIHSVPSMPGRDLDFITDPAPCLWTVIIRLWPYKDCVLKIEAVA